MEDKMVSFKLDENIVRSIVTKKIQAEILSVLNGKEELVEHIVSSALKQKVNSKGKIANSSYDNNYDFLEIVTKNTIHEKAQEALQEWLKENTEMIKSAVIKELNSPGRRETIAKAYLDAIENSLKCKWSMNCNISFRDNDI